MCGSGGDVFWCLDGLPMSDLCALFGNTSRNMAACLIRSQYKMYLEHRTRYFQLLQEIKEKIRDVPQDSLIEMVNVMDGCMSFLDPDNIGETSETISDMAKKEIHRRSLQHFTYNMRKGCAAVTWRTPSAFAGAFARRN